MTGTIISQFYYKTGLGDHMRFFANGSFFFIEPDVAITAYENLAEERSKEGMVYAEDYIYFVSELKHFESDLLNKPGIQCIRLEREWLKEFPDKNITEIHFPQPLSQECFKISNEKPKSGQQIICEGYEYADYLNIQDEPGEMNFAIIGKQEASKIKLFRQAAFINEILTNDCIYTEVLKIDKIDVLYTTCFPVTGMIGGPILDFQTKEVIGVLSHETDDSYKSDEGLKGVGILPNFKL